MRPNKGRKRKLFGGIGQSTAEYAVLLVAVTAALITMQTYIKRAVQGRFLYSVGQFTGGDARPALYQDKRTVSSAQTNTSGIKVQFTDGSRTWVYEDGHLGSTPQTTVRSSNVRTYADD
jgi:Flp pilus assembly pilin Flp